MAYTDPLNPQPPQAPPADTPLFPPPQNPTQVIQPDNPPPTPPKHGSWDDILTPAEEPRISFATTENLEAGNSADNQPMPAKLHDLSDALRAQPDSVPVTPEETSQVAESTDIFEPVPTKAQEPRSMFDALDEPESAHPQIIKRSSDEAIAATHAAVDHSAVPEQQKASSPVQNPVATPQAPDVPFQISGSDASTDPFEQELEDTFAARFARYGKTAVTALALPFLSSGRLTKSILKNGLPPRSNDSTQAEIPDFSTPIELPTTQTTKYTPPVAVANQNVDSSAIARVSNMYGISRHEALTKLRAAVTHANQQAGQEVARILDHDPTIETDDEVGVYIDVEGGRALSLNSEDVMRVLSQFL